MDDVRNIGDAGDSTCACDCDTDEINLLNGNGTEKTDNGCIVNQPLAEMISGIKRALQCGDHSALKSRLAKLNGWRHSLLSTTKHNYWRVAQYIGETELTKVCVLLTVTNNKMDPLKWSYLDSALASLSLCLCNREVICRLQTFSNSLTPILISALNQQCSESAILHSLSIITEVLIVCRARFARGLVSRRFLDKLVEGLVEQGLPPKSLHLLDMVLEVIKSLLMCGQPNIHDYCHSILTKLLPVASAGSSRPEDQEQKDVLHFYAELVKSIEDGPQACANYWTRGKLRKDLLSEFLGQPWLYLYCSWPGCGCQNGTANVFFRKCSACGMARYCSRACQEKHWISGHCGTCRKVSSPHDLGLVFPE